MMRRGYARVSTSDQDLTIQKDALQQYGCERIYSDKATGKHAKRPGLTRLLRELEKGDVVVITKLDRLARSARETLNITHDWEQRGIQLRALQQPIDTTTAIGRAFFQMLAVFAELERSFIVERTSEGRHVAKAEDKRLGGRHLNGKDGSSRFGRKRALTDQQVAIAREMIESGQYTMATAAQQAGVHRTTLMRRLAEVEE